MSYVRSKLKTKILLVFSLFFLMSSIANAQSFGETLDVNVSPANPGPNTRVYMSVRNVSQNLDTLQITWSLDGRVAKQGTGVKDFEFTTGALGSVSSVTVSAGGISKNVQVRPTEVDLVWETDGYVPPFYKGKALRVFQGNLRLVAIPHFVNSQGVSLNPNSLIYSWRNSGVLNAEASGYGKNSLAFSGSVISRPLTIEVTVSTPDNSYRGSKQITIEETAPMILLYEDHPLYGVMYNNAINNKEFSLRNTELKVTAAPYFFSAQNKDAEKLTYSWSVNGSNTQSSLFKESVVLRREGTASGLSNISLQLDNKNEFLQFATAAFRVKFENQ